MYAHPKKADKFIEQIKRLSEVQSSMTWGSSCWNAANEAINGLRIEWAKERMKKDPLALTYK